MIVPAEEELLRLEMAAAERLLWHGREAASMEVPARRHRTGEAFYALFLGVCVVGAKRDNPDVNVSAKARRLGISECSLRNYTKLAEALLFHKDLKGAESGAIFRTVADDLMDPSKVVAAKFEGAASGMRNKVRLFLGILPGQDVGMGLAQLYNKYGITSAARKRVKEVEEEMKVLEESRFDIAKREADRVADDLEEIAEDRHPRARIEFMKDAVFYEFRRRVKQVAELLDAAAAKKVKRVS